MADNYIKISYLDIYAREIGYESSKSEKVSNHPRSNQLTNTVFTEILKEKARVFVF